MYNFSEQFKATKSIIDLGHYNDPSWVKETLSSIKELRKSLPKNPTAYSIAENLNQPEWYVSQVLVWCNMPEEKLKIELESHGSILFYYLRDYITPDEEEAIYEQLAKAKYVLNATAEHINNSLLEKFSNNSFKEKKRMTKEEIQIEKLKGIDQTVWSFLNSDIESWGVDNEFKSLIKKIGKSSKYNLGKRESLFFIDSFTSYAKVGYLDVKSPKKKASLYDELKTILG
jgi:hypothetical protein